MAAEDQHVLEQLGLARPAQSAWQGKRHFSLCSIRQIPGRSWVGTAWRPASCAPKLQCPIEHKTRLDCDCPQVAHTVPKIYCGLEQQIRSPARDVACKGPLELQMDGLTSSCALLRQPSQPRSYRWTAMPGCCCVTAEGCRGPAHVDDSAMPPCSSAPTACPAPRPLAPAGLPLQHRATHLQLGTQMPRAVV